MSGERREWRCQKRSAIDENWNRKRLRICGSTVFVRKEQMLFQRLVQFRCQCPSCWVWAQNQKRSDNASGWVDGKLIPMRPQQWSGRCDLCREWCGRAWELEQCDRRDRWEANGDRGWEWQLDWSGTGGGGINECLVKTERSNVLESAICVAGGGDGLGNQSKVTDTEEERLSETGV